VLTCTTSTRTERARGTARLRRPMALLQRGSWSPVRADCGIHPSPPQPFFRTCGYTAGCAVGWRARPPGTTARPRIRWFSEKNGVADAANEGQCGATPRREVGKRGISGWLRNETSEEEEGEEEHVFERGRENEVR
jgi:hypothetical protein